MGTKSTSKQDKVEKYLSYAERAYNEGNELVGDAYLRMAISEEKKK